MAEIVSTVEISRPPGEVFAYATDPSRFGEWQREVVSAGMQSDGPSNVGSRFTTTRRIGGSERTTTQEITQIDPPRGWTAQGVDGPIRVKVAVAVEPLDDDARSRVTISLDFEGQGIGKLIVPLFVRRQAASEAPDSCRRLKERLEQESSRG